MACSLQIFSLFETHRFVGLLLSGIPPPKKKTCDISACRASPVRHTSTQCVTSYYTELSVQIHMYINLNGSDNDWIQLAIVARVSSEGKGGAQSFVLPENAHQIPKLVLG